MELIHIKGGTWAADTKGLTIPFYKLSDRDIVMLDTGYARPQREEFAEFLPEHGLRPRGVIISHTHRDHSGNAEYFKKLYGSLTAAGEYEAKVASDFNLCRPTYGSMTICEADALRDFLYTTDVAIAPVQDRISFCGAEFGILQLPGHTPGQIGTVTPDGVAYLADALMGETMLEFAKLPTVDDHAEDRRTKESLRSLKYDKYVLAHKGVPDDLGALIDKNLAFLDERAEFLLGTLKDGMSFGEWEEAFYRAAGMRTTHPLLCGVYDRNFRSFTCWLADTGRVEIARINGVNHYTKNR